MAMIHINARKDGVRFGDLGASSIDVWIIHTSLHVPAGTPGADPEFGRYEIHIREVSR